MLYQLKALYEPNAVTFSHIGNLLSRECQHPMQFPELHSRDGTITQSCTHGLYYFVSLEAKPLRNKLMNIILQKIIVDAMPQGSSSEYHR